MTIPQLYIPVVGCLTPLQHSFSTVHCNLACISSTMEIHVMKLPMKKCWHCFLWQFGTLKWVLQPNAMKWFEPGGLVLQACVCYRFTGEIAVACRCTHCWLGKPSRREIWHTDLWERWHSVTVPPWKSLSSLVWLILLLMFASGDIWLAPYVMHQWLRQLNSLIKGSPHTFAVMMAFQ